MTKYYRLVAVSDSAIELKGGQSSRVQIPDQDIYLHLDKVTHIGRLGGLEDFKIPPEMVQYSSKHCNLHFSEEVCFSS